jgi:hypothetical protein
MRPIAPTPERNRQEDPGTEAEDQMSRQVHDCTRTGCHAVSNGSLAGWWGVRVTTGGEVTVAPFAAVELSPGYQPCCGMAHALSAVSEAMTKMQAKP